MSPPLATIGNSNPVERLNVAVVGASLGGLSVANVLQRLGARVTVFEAFQAQFSERGGALGTVDADIVRDIRGDDGPGPQRLPGRGFFYGDVWRYLYEGLSEGTVVFGADVAKVTLLDDSAPALVIDDEERTFDLVIGADGGKSTIRPLVTSAIPTYAGYALWRGLVPRGLVATKPDGFALVGEHAYSTGGFPCAGPPEQGELWNVGMYMAMPASQVHSPTRNRQVSTSTPRPVPSWFLPLVQELFGAHNADFWEQCVAKGKVTLHPVWELAADRVVRGRILLLGDAAHMASPRTGAGAYAAMRDAVSLRDALCCSQSLDEALQMYNDDTVARGEQLYQASRKVAAEYAPGGPAKSTSPAEVLAAQKQSRLARRKLLV